MAVFGDLQVREEIMRSGLRHLAVLSALFFCLSGTLLHVSQPPGEQKFIKVKLGPQVNCPVRDGFPVISPDGKTLYFMRENYVGDDVRALVEGMTKDVSQLTEKELKEFMEKLAKIPKDQADVRAQQTVWSSERQSDGSWGQAHLLPSPVNSEANVIICSVLPDNNALFLARPLAALAQVLQGDDVAALSHRTKDGWSEPEYLKIKAFRHVLPRYGAALSPSNKALLLAIGNEESLGGLDIYVSFLEDDGGWSKPRNLGPAVNSKENDYGMYIAPDDRTVYFASNRPGGYGESDIYMTRRLDDSWLKWSPPKNLGPDINDGLSQESLSVDATGNYAFIAEGPQTKEDIYEFALPVEFRPTPVAFIRGVVGDPDKKPLAASISYERLRDGAEMGMALSHPASGKYQIALPLGENYGFLAGASGYVSVAENIDLTKATEGEVFERDLTLVPLRLQTPIRLNNIFFESDKAVLLPESRRELKRLAGLLRQYDKMEIEIDGHTDSQNTEDYNQKLSEARAAAVLNHLVREEGIAASRLTSKGYGESRPIAGNDTKEGRQLNRRVEFLIVKM
jgi:outer membrane protein OmpA-like peptidoglycan-associated protein